VITQAHAAILTRNSSTARVNPPISPRDLGVLRMTKELSFGERKRVCVPHRRFMFDPQSRPCLTSKTNLYPGDLLERRPGSSWLRAETRRWQRQVQAGILRTGAWWALFKRMSVRDWLIFAEEVRHSADHRQARRPRQRDHAQGGPGGDRRARHRGPRDPRWQRRRSRC
jgi:hypothetical protein